MRNIVVIAKIDHGQAEENFSGISIPQKRLIEDTKSGKANVMMPKDLWESHDDYQAFLLDDFRGHIYQERSKQLA